MALVEKFHVPVLNGSTVVKSPNDVQLRTAVYKWLASTKPAVTINQSVTAIKTLLTPPILHPAPRSSTLNSTALVERSTAPVEGSPILSSTPAFSLNLPSGASDSKVCNSQNKVLNLDSKVCNSQNKVLNLDSKVSNSQNKVLNLDSKVANSLNSDSKVLHKDNGVGQRNGRMRIIPLDYATFPLLEGPPRIGDKIAFRVGIFFNFFLKKYDETYIVTRDNITALF